MENSFAESTNYYEFLLEPRLGMKIPEMVVDIPVVIDHDMIEIWWDRLQTEKQMKCGDFLGSLDDSVIVNPHSHEEKVDEILKEYSMIRGSLEIKYRTYEQMLKNEENVKNVETPKFPPEFLACCSCTDGCKTNKCECRWRSYDDNRFVKICSNCIGFFSWYSDAV